MAREDVNIKVSADVAEAVKMWRAMEQGPQAMANELDQLGKKGKTAASGMTGEFTKLVGQWASVGAAIATAKQLLDAYIATQREAVQKSQTATRSSDQMVRELFLLTPGDKTEKQIRSDLLSLAKERRVQPQQAKEVAGALLGAGYSYEQTMGAGGAADAMLRTMSATNATGKGIDAKALTDALTGHLSATGQKLTAENLAKAGMASQSMFASTKLELTDLLALGPRAKNISAITGWQNELIPILSQFKDVTTADVGATALHTAVVRLKGAKDNARSRGALKDLGLKPEDVDFAGESPFQVQDRLVDAFEKAGPDAQRMMARLFGNEGLVAGNVLFTRAGRDEMHRRLGMSSNAEAFNAAAAVNEGSLQAKSNMAAAEEMQTRVVDGLIDTETARTAISNVMRKRGGFTDYEIGTAQQRFDNALEWGDGPELAIDRALRGVLAHEDGSRLAGDIKKDIIKRSQADPINVNVTLQDQDGIAIPHKSEVSNLNQAK